MLVHLLPEDLTVLAALCRLGEAQGADATGSRSSSASEPAVEPRRLPPPRRRMAALLRARLGSPKPGA